jgi:CrcB protein
MNTSTRNLLSLIIGGFVGAVLRFEIEQWLPNPTDGFPWSTLAINWAGCLFLGWFLTLALQSLSIRMEIRLGLGTGLTGAFTTFSSFSVQSVHLFMIGHQTAAFLYILSSALSGLLLTLTGVALANAQSGKRKGELLH